MLLPPKVAHGVADGSVTLAFRRWRRQDVAVGSEFRTVAGVVRVDAVGVVDAAAITDVDAIAAGWPDAERLRRQRDRRRAASCSRSATRSLRRNELTREGDTVSESELTVIDPASR